MERETHARITITIALFVITFVVLLVSASPIHAKTPRWVASGLREHAVMNFAMDPRNSKRLYAVTGEGMARSTNGGVSWRFVRSRRRPLPPNCGFPELSPTNPRIAYAFCQKVTDTSPTVGSTVSFDIYKSVDSGARWTRTGHTPDGVPTIFFIRSDPTNAHRLYFITGQRLFSSANSGRTWVARHRGLKNGFIATFAIDPKRPRTLYAVTRKSDMGPSGLERIFKSVNAGKRWTEVGIHSFNFSTIITAPTTTHNLYASTYSSGMIMSVDGGKSWRAGGLPPFTSLVVNPRNPRVLYAGTSEGVFWSNNGGESWTSVNEGLSNRTVYTLTLDPISRTTLYVGTNDGVARLRITGRQQAKVMAVLESPEANQPVSGVAVLRGWAFSVQPGVQVSQIQPSAGRGLPLTCCSIRRDIQKAFPHFPTQQTLYSGWGVGIPWGLHEPGKYVVRVTIQTSNGVVFYPRPHVVTVVKPGDSEFLDQFLVSTANASIVGNELVLNNVVIRDAKTRRQSRIRASFRWFTGSQSFGLTQTATTGSVSAPQVSRSLPLVRALAGLGRSLIFVPPAYAAARMRAFIESPEEKQVVSGSGVIRGWVFSEWRNVFTRKARLRIDGVLQGEIPCCSQRSDIEAAFSHEVPAGTMLGAVEWSAVISYGELEPGSHQLEVQLEDTLGEMLTLERRVTVLHVGGFSSLNQCDLSKAIARIEGEEVLLKRVYVRDKESRKTKRVDIRLRWFGHSQSLGIVASSM